MFYCYYYYYYHYYCHLRFFLNLRQLFLAVLESGAPLSSSIEEALYKCTV